MLRTSGSEDKKAGCVGVEEGGDEWWWLKRTGKKKSVERWMQRVDNQSDGCLAHVIWSALDSNRSKYLALSLLLFFLRRKLRGPDAMDL